MAPRRFNLFYPYRPPRGEPPMASPRPPGNHYPSSEPAAPAAGRGSHPPERPPPPLLRAGPALALHLLEPARRAAAGAADRPPGRPAARGRHLARVPGGGRQHLLARVPAGPRRAAPPGGRDLLPRAEPLVRRPRRPRPRPPLRLPPGRQR